MSSKKPVKPVAILLAFLAAAWGAPKPVDFNRDIRPILSDKCFTCHGHDAANRTTKLRFDTEAGAKIMLRNGRRSIVAGDAEHSELYRRIASGDPALRMPPASAGRDKLSPGEVDLIRRWIEEGAHWQVHWSLIPPQRPEPPEVANKNWVRNPIDSFILQRLEREGLRPSPEAGRATLIRRLTLDLTGLPPTIGETEAFTKDATLDAYEKVVDRLLASPAYAERMAFRWMEAARYGDTNGYQSDGNRDMWRWRDWVLDAYRLNMPFDRFTIEQLAGDLLPKPTLEQQIATGFHRNHRTNAEGGIVPEEFRTEYVADRAETTSIVWLGLTMGCARCHDHKYDPITQKDFYRLFAYFNNVPEKGLVYNWGNDEPLIKAPTPQQQRDLKALDENVAAAEQRVAKLAPAIDKAQRAWEKIIRRSTAPDWTVNEGLVFRQKHDEDGPAREFDGKEFIETDGAFADFDYLDPVSFTAWVKPDAPNGAILSHSEDYFEGQGHGLYLIQGKLRLHITFRWTDIGLRVETTNSLKLHEWQHVVVTYDGKRYASGVKMYINGRAQELKILFDDLNWPMKSKRPFRIGAGGGLRFQGAIVDVRVYNRALTPQEAAIIPLRESVAQIAALPASSRTDSQSAKLRSSFLETSAPKNVREARDELLRWRKQREKFYESLPTVMVMAEGRPRDTFVLKRGAYDSYGEKVTPGVPAVLPPLKPEWPNNRLGLARWLVDRSNPLTARVTVNRFWQMFFGNGIIKTMEDFGSQGEAPVHPELLDWLAVEFMDSGWNVKHILKTIVMSATYRQSSHLTPDLLQKDPDNRLLARGPRVRLGPEMIRDQALAVSGLLVQKLGGPSVKPYQPPGLWQELAGGKGYVVDQGDGLYRRSLYTFWKRTVAPPFMINFDSPSRETCTVRENRTNTPLQALNLMNDETFLEASRKLAERIIREGGAAPEQRLEHVYRVVLARAPQPNEMRILLDTLHRFEQRYSVDSKSAAAFVSYGASARGSSVDISTLAAYTAVASLVLDLDETVTKQ